MNISGTLHSVLKNENIKLGNNYTVENENSSSIFVTKNKRAVHSKYNTEAECKRALSNIKKNKNLVIIYGFGLGIIVKYLTDHIKEYFNEDIIDNLKIIVVVEDEVLFKYSYYNAQNSYNDNIFFMHHNDGLNYVLKIIDYKTVNGISLSILPSLTKEEKEKASIFYSEILNNIEKAFADFLTNMYFENIWTKNVILNSEYIGVSADISSFKNVLNDYNAILICAGPTLKNSIEKIKKERENIIIIAVDTAYSILSKNGIESDFIVTVDGGFFNSLDFIYENKSFPYLLSDMISSNLILKNIKDKTSVITFTSAEFLGIIENLKNNISISSLKTANTVASTIIDFANYLGCKNILLIGFDNSYPYYERHAKHALSYEYNINKTNRLNTMESIYFDTIKSSSNINNCPPTDYVFENQIEYFKTLKEKYKNMNIMRITSDAINIECIEEGTIDDIKIEHSRKKALIKAQESYKINRGKDIKNIYENIDKLILDFQKQIINIYDNAIKERTEDETLENIKNMYNKTINLIKEYEKIIPILKTILSTAVIMTKRSDKDIFTRLMFLLTETIKNTNYFHTRISMLLRRL